MAEATSMDLEEVPVVEPVDALVLLFEEAEDEQVSQPQKAMEIFRTILTDLRDDEDALKVKEQCIYK